MSSLLLSRDRILYNFAAELNATEELTREGRMFDAFGAPLALPGNGDVFIGFNLVESMVIFGIEVVIDVADVTVTLYEESVFSGGTPSTVVNRNRNSLRTSDATIFEGVVQTVLGTPIDKAEIISTAGRSRSVVFAESISVLKPNTAYMIGIHNNTAAAGTVEATGNIAQLA